MKGSDARGLSAIVTTLIILLLVMVAIGIVWFVVGNLVRTSSGQINYKTKCVQTEVSANSVIAHTGNIYQVRLSRDASDDELGGVKLIFSSEDEEDNFIQDVSGNIPALGIKVVNVTVSEIVPDKVQVSVYFNSDEGEQYLCQGFREFSF